MGEVERLRREVEQLKAERDAYACAGLLGLSGLVPTPEKGYVRDGGPGLFRSDMGRMRKEVDRIKSELAWWERKGAHRCIDAYCSLCDKEVPS